MDRDGRNTDNANQASRSQSPSTSTALLRRRDSASTLGPASTASSPAASIRSWRPGTSRRAHRSSSTVAENKAKQRRRIVAFVSAVSLALCTGSVSVFSLYGHIFQERLRYTQLQVNGLAIAASLACYLPVPLFGYVCDRAGPAPLSFVSSLLFGGGYGLAALLYKTAETRAQPGSGPAGGDDAASAGSAYAAMSFAFVCIGLGTSSMYLSAVSTCAKNFGRGRHRGLALAVPIAAYGLSGMWESQVGSRLFCETARRGANGDLDVYRFFLFLAILLFVLGQVGTFGLKVVDQDELIEEAVEELERSGILNNSVVFNPPQVGRGAMSYGTIIESRHSFDEQDDAEDARILEPSKDSEDEAEEARQLKRFVLNSETHRFLTDHTMWLFAFGFFFIIGPGECFINVLGTVIKTLYAPHTTTPAGATSAATHVSIVGITSTVIRLLTGSLTDLLAPSPSAQHMQLTASVRSLPPQSRFAVSRATFLLFFAVVLALGLLALASGLVQGHGERFWVVSALVGTGYGAVFSLTPIMITVIWGVENFSTNWGIVAMFPAFGATFWGLVYSAVYQAGASGDPASVGEGGPAEDIFCYGMQCYAPTFAAMTVAVFAGCLMVWWAWKGPNGWKDRGFVI